VSCRADPLDAIVLPTAASPPPEAPAIDAMAAALGHARRIGTGSVRRISQLIRLLPGAGFLNIRGNLDTRLRKLDAGEYDAIVVAAAGLRRLGFEKRISLTLPAEACVPAPGQGIVAIEVRESDERGRRAAGLVADAATAAALEAERALVTALGGGCQMPIGALATTPDADTLELVATVVSPDGEDALKTRVSGAWSDAARLGSEAGARLLADGAAEILKT
jgi:hydroxymethylbilane synthase